MATADKKTFYGISLKKKRKTNAGEPTLINKAFDSVLDGKQFDVFQWTTPYLNTNSAQQLVEKYNPLLGAVRPRYDHVTALSNQPYFNKDKLYIIQDYISKKLHYRNV
jgi:hypothetical protein